MTTPPLNPLTHAAVDIPELPGPDHPNQGPVVALDVDGVINYGPPQPLPPGVTTVETCIPAWATARAAFLVGHGRVNLPVQLTVDANHGTWIRSLLERDITVVWCTTWETAAPVVYGPLLNIPALPVVQLHPHPRMSDTSIDCKRLALADMFPGRPLVWLDDHLSYRDQYHWRHPTWPTLTRWVNPRLGLDPSLRQDVDTWLTQHPAGATEPVTYLDYEHASTWQLETAHGTARLRPDGRILPGRTLRAHLGIPAGTPIHRQGAVSVGDPLTFAVHNGYAAKSVEGPPVHSITLAHYHQRDHRVPNYQQLPNLTAARAAQEAAHEVAATLTPPLPADIVVRENLLRIVVDDARVSVELDHDTSVVTLSRRSSDGTVHEIACHPVSTLDVITRDRRTWQPTLDPAKTMTWALRTHHQWHTRQTCPHRDAGGPHCPDCGQAISDLPQDDTTSTSRG